MIDNNLLTIILSLAGFALGYAAAKLEHKENIKTVIKDKRVTLVHQMPPHLGGYSLKYHHDTGLYEDDLPGSSSARKYSHTKDFYVRLASNSDTPSIRHTARQFHKAISLFDAELTPSYFESKLK